jgi:ligand-binding sensor domain-containing protein/two-component sensor histidine kinase
MQDAQGFLWVATNTGVARFDGHEFRNYGTEDGLPFPSARKIVETADGGLLVLGRGKLARRAPGFSASGPEFALVDPPGLIDRAGEIFDVAVAADGTVAAVGTRGAARLRGNDLEPIDLGPVPRANLPEAEQAWAAAFDVEGALWVIRTYGITRVDAGGVPHTLVLPPGRLLSSGFGWLPSMMVDRSGHAWVLTVDAGAWRLTAGVDGVPAVAERLDDTSGVRGPLLRALHESTDGTLWVGTSNAALTRVERTASGRRFVHVGPAEGFPDIEVSSLLTDRQGNLWAGTVEAGLVRLAADGLTSWGEADGLRPAGVAAILDAPGGVLALVGGLNVAAVRDGRVDPPWPIRDVRSGWGNQQLVAADAEGRLWLATGVGLAKYPRGTRLGDLRSRPPERVFDVSDGLPGQEVHRLFATSDGTIWFGLIHARSGVCRVDANGSAVRCFGPDDGLPDPAWGAAFAEDAEGHVWAGLYGGGVFRFRDGRWESWPEVSPDRQAGVQSIRRGSKGRLWVTGSPGLVRIDDAATDRPSFRRYAREDGLAAPDTFDVAEDRFGDIYVSSVRGVERIDPEGGAIRRYTSADGLPANRATILHADPRGDLWVGTSRGLARLVPTPAAAQDPPRVYVTAASVAGRRRAAARPLDLASDERTVEFGFTSPSFRAGETMRFQWRLVGGSEDWSPPGTSRAIVLAGLAPGRYRFEVRAMDGEGAVSAPEAVAFRIRPPLWQRAWFIGLVGVALAGIVAALYRVRVARLVELERVRTRIATDLHDDVGASLSQIAVLSQYASRQAARGGDEARGSLARITELSGSVVDAMSDVVWSINPARDRMSDLVRRMRRFAVDLFSESEAALTLDLPADGADEPLAPEVRRQVFLVFKEALRNAARHSRASAVGVSFRHERDALLLVVSDDGVGIAVPGASGSSTGFGLENMRRRAAAIGGMLEVTPGPAGGTEVRLRIPVSGRRYLSRWTGTTGNRAS